MAFRECHLAHIPVGFSNQRDESKEKEKKKSFPSVSIKVLRGGGGVSDPCCSHDVIGRHVRNRRSFEAE